MSAHTYFGDFALGLSWYTIKLATQPAYAGKAFR